MRKYVCLATAAVAAVLLVLPAAGSAYTASPLWKCRASALYTSIAGNNRVEPIVANGNPSTAGNKSPDRAQCSNEEAGADNLATPLGIPNTLVSAQSASAKTTIDPELGLAIDQKVTATSRVEKLGLPLGGTTVLIGVGAANSTATGSCVNGAPKLDATSSMADLTLGGTPISLNELLAGVQQLLQPLGVLVDIKFNEQVRDGHSLIVRAAHIKLLGSNQAVPLADIVIAESKIDTEQFTCDKNHQIPGINQQICPTGSTYDAMTGLCIIAVAGSGTNGAGSQIIVVGRPFQGPSGGTVVPLVKARQLYGNKLCLEGKGPAYAVVGTKGRDKITGTNGRDRILGLGGNDSLDGGRGADCIDGGSGNDRISGGIGSDRIIGGAGNDVLRGDLDNDVITGGAGNDKISGGAGADHLNGGDGNDIISGNFGADRIDAGRGNDVVNIATQGPVATANCGPGKDIIRLNGKERKSLQGCETSYVLKDR
jgi:hypothetical protein